MLGSLLRMGPLSNTMNNKFRKGHLPWNKELHLYLGGKRFEKGHKTWSKGLTKETDERLMMSALHMIKSPPIRKICEDCGKEFEIRAYRRNTAHFCSLACHARSRVYKMHNAIKGRPSWNSGKKFPQFSGSNHPNWKGGVFARLAKWRTAVFKRDDYICQMCGKRGGRLNSHHILPYRACTAIGVDKFKWDKNNGVTLCDSCHFKTIQNEWMFIPKFLK